jgi:hypothetical protein
MALSHPGWGLSWLFIHAPTRPATRGHAPSLRATRHPRPNTRGHAPFYPPRANTRQTRAARESTPRHAPSTPGHAPGVPATRHPRADTRRHAPGPSDTRHPRPIHAPTRVEFMCHAPSTREHARHARCVSARGNIWRNPRADTRRVYVTRSVHARFPRAATRHPRTTHAPTRAVHARPRATSTRHPRGERGNSDTRRHAPSLCVTRRPRPKHAPPPPVWRRRVGATCYSLLD